MLYKIKNGDNKCIKWCFLAFKHYDDVKAKDYKVLPNGYIKYENEFIEPKGQKYPIDIQKDIPKIERLNNIKINVFGYDNKPFVIYSPSKKVEKEKI